METRDESPETLKREAVRVHPVRSVTKGLTEREAGLILAYAEASRLAGGYIDIHIGEEGIVPFILGSDGKRVTVAEFIDVLLEGSYESDEISHEVSQAALKFIRAAVTGAQCPTEEDTEVDGTA